MDEQEIRQRIEAIVERELQQDLSSVPLDKDLRQHISLDSMQFVEVYAAIVEEFGIEVPASIVRATTMRQMIEALKGELEKRPA